MMYEEFDDNKCKIVTTSAKDTVALKHYGLDVSQAEWKKYGVRMHAKVYGSQRIY